MAIPTFDQALFAKHFSGFDFQLNIAFETDLYFIDEYNHDVVPLEVYFDFLGTPLRWINATEDLLALLVVPVISMDDYSGAYEVAHKFISWAISSVHIPIKQVTSVAGSLGISPILRQPRRMAMHWQPYQFIDPTDPASLTDKEWGARLLYREGVNSESPFYKYFSFYKVAQLPFIFTTKNNEEDVKDADFDKWVLQQFASVTDSEVKAWAGTDPGKYLRRLRDTIGHVETLRDGTPAVSPGSLSDIYRINKSVFFVQQLAEEVIKAKCVV
jgi:hypothetical protein